MSEAEIKPQVIESPEIKQLQQYEFLRQVLLIVFVSAAVFVRAIDREVFLREGNYCG